MTRGRNQMKTTLSRLLGSLALLLVMGCSSVPSGEPAPQRATPDIRVTYNLPPSWALLEALSRQAILNLTVYYSIPPADVKIHLERPFSPTPGWYIAGYYKSADRSATGRPTLHIWVRSPTQDLPRKLIYETLVHEWLHHYDNAMGIPPGPQPHNKRTEARIRRAGLLSIARFGHKALGLTTPPPPIAPGY